MNIDSMIQGNPQALVTSYNGVLVADSLEVADRFGKRHTHVLRSIDDLINQLESQSTQNWADYFIPDDYQDNKNRTQRRFKLTRDGFSLLVMGFTGPAALHWKLLYIEAFNKMEQALRSKAAKVDDLTAQCKKLLIENAVLKEAGKYNPVNPAQVVRAISADYLDSIEFDEENGTADAKSIARAIRKVHDAEPNLFKPAGDDGDDDNGAGGSGNGFRGKGPGGAGSTKNGELEAKKAEALEMLGIKKDDKK